MKLISLITCLNLTGVVFGAAAAGGTASTHLPEPLSWLQTHLDDLRQDKITTLTLRFRRIGPDGARALAEALKVNTRLTTLDIFANSIGHEGAQALAEALRENTSLTELFLHSNQIGAAGAQALAQVLKENTSLTTLRLNHNQIGDAGAEALAQVLKENTSLTEVNLGDNKIGPAGALALVDGLKTNTKITSLVIHGNQIEYDHMVIRALLTPEGVETRKWRKIRSLTVTLVTLDGDKYPVLLNTLNDEGTNFKELAVLKNGESELVTDEWDFAFIGFEAEGLHINLSRRLLMTWSAERFQDFVKNPELLLIWRGDEEASGAED